MSNNQSRWYFSKEALINTPSRKCGIDYDKELFNRQQAANLIQDMGRLLSVNQLCINTAIVYMHRFYIFHSFQRFHRNAIAACALFLAAKVEEQPRKLEYVIKVAHKVLHNGQPPLDPKSEYYQEQAQELVVNENIMLQTLGFDIAIEHPHTFVVKCCQLVRASKDLAQTSYIMATNSLHLTTMCLQYRPTMVACVCIHLACKWSNWEIPRSSEGKDWFYYVDKSVTAEMLEELTSEFLAILDKCPSRLKRKILSGSANQGISNEAIAHLTPKEDKKVSPVKNDNKSKPLPPLTAAGYNQPSTSKASEPSTSTSTLTPTSISIKKQSPSPPAKKPKDDPNFSSNRTHSMSHTSQTSGQATNIHSSISTSSHSQGSVSATDSRQRSQPIKDDKKLSLLKSDMKTKPPSSSSHPGQMSSSRQSSELSSIPPPMISNEFDRRSPSPATRKIKKEIPPHLTKPQTSSHTSSHNSSGQSSSHNSVSFNARSQGNTSNFSNETKSRPAIKEEKVSSVKNEVRPKPAALVANNHSTSVNKFPNDTHSNSSSLLSTTGIKKEKRSPSPAEKKERRENPPNVQKNLPPGHISQMSGHSTNSHTTSISYSAYKEKREKEKAAALAQMQQHSLQSTHHQLSAQSDLSLGVNVKDVFNCNNKSQKISKEKPTNPPGPPERPERVNRPTLEGPTTHIKQEKHYHSSGPSTHIKQESNESIERIDRIDRLNKPDRPDRPERTDRNDRTDHTDRPEKINRTDRLERVERSDRPEKPDRQERIDRHERLERLDRTDRHDRHERRDNRTDRPEHPERYERPERHDKSERLDKVERQERSDKFDRTHQQLPTLQHLQPPPMPPSMPPSLLIQPDAITNELNPNSSEMPRMPRLIPAANQERFDRLMKLERSQDSQQQIFLQQQEMHQQQQILLQQQQLQQQQLQQPVKMLEQHGETGESEDSKDGIIKTEASYMERFDRSNEKIDQSNELEGEEEDDEDINESKVKSKDKDKHHHRHHRHHQGKHRHEHKKHHKEKHKSKHKHKDKDKEKERDRDKHRSEHEDANHRDKDFKLTLTVPKEENRSEEEIERPSPIKLKISKKQINYSGSESELNSESNVMPSSLRIVIPKERLGVSTGGSSSTSNNNMPRSEGLILASSSSRKRKNSPKDDVYQERDSIKIKKEKITD